MAGAKGNKWVVPPVLGVANANEVAPPKKSVTADHVPMEEVRLHIDNLAFEAQTVVVAMQRLANDITSTMHCEDESDENDKRLHDIVRLGDTVVRLLDLLAEKTDLDLRPTRIAEAANG